MAAAGITIPGRTTRAATADITLAGMVPPTRAGTTETPVPAIITAVISADASAGDLDPPHRCLLVPRLPDCLACATVIA